MGRREGMTPLRVRDMVRETPAIMSVYLEHPDGEPSTSSRYGSSASGNGKSLGNAGNDGDVDGAAPLSF